MPRHQARHRELQLDLADKVDRWGKCFATFFPLCWADLTGVLAHINCSLDLADELDSVAANTFTGDFHDLDDAIWINDERRAICKALAFAQDAEIVADHVILVTEHMKIDFSDGWRAVMP